jgi:small nuclear ribonucleoprotein (snRNP)-like protein
MRNNIELKGTLISYDNHLNIILSKAEESSIDVQGNKIKRKLEALYLRGDGIILISPLNKGITET